ncbi:phage holin family protein [Cupriavidus taiwanensis]|uniref:Transmembrane protein n=2 Tax=Cupriavidus TaxID=106589 RepID=A0A375I9G7_9BURK|nr:MULTISPECIES: phage holin family protein [Cupriavidus]MBB2916155.1 putative membrane protein YqjE [Cupriavidus alkaliphilus]MBB3005857.1 putative membrane protein YqjE [Cupriavidus alkaliphilus]MBB3012192.1 putative membrane protein YqjE [Cupriavidus alkaliphilus]MCO4861622.1 phage holin family protein [Cupriavidus sp. WGlv3]PVY81441.1 putative membrane protein YqjE [Cupriavidus alkaliphilus]
MSEATPSPKFLDAVRNLAGSLVAMVQTRLELASVELAEERTRLLKVALLALFGLAFFGLGLVTLTALIAILFWDTYRWQALGALTVLYLVLCAVCLAYARSVLRNAPPMLEATLAEIDKDREILRR